MNMAATASTATNTVLRNTYMLLSMTLAFSAFMSWVTVDMQMTFSGAIAGVVGTIVCLIVLMMMRNTALALPLVFLFTGGMGAFMGPTIGHYLALSNGTEIVFMSMAGTAIAFLGLSVYAITSKKDFSAWGGFLFVGLLVLIGLMLFNFFFAIPALTLAISAMAIMIFSALILYDTSLIVNGGETNYVMATVSLYLDIINLFLHMLQIVSFITGDD